MSSMFKKKGGLAFKPKIPSARPRPAASAPAAPAPKTVGSQPSIDAQPDTASNGAPKIPEHTLSHLDHIPPSIAAEVAAEAPKQASQPPPEATQSPAKPQAVAEARPQANIRPRKSSTAAAEATHEKASGTDDSISADVDPRLQSDASSETTFQFPKPPTPIPPISPPDASPEAPGRGQSIDGPHSETALRIAPDTDARPQVDTPTAATTAPSASKPSKKPATRKSAPAKTAQEPDGDGNGTTRPKKRQRKASQQGDDAAPKPRPQKRQASTSTGDGSEAKAKTRKARSPTPEDAEDQTVDLQQLRMADLTKDLRIGKKFSRHDELRDRERQARIKARLEKDGEQADGEAEASGSASPMPDGQAKTKRATPGSSSAPPPAATSGPQFRIVDGQIVVDQNSLVMDRHARAAAAQGDMETIEENDFTRLITSSSFMNTSKLRGPNIWNDQETELFYRGLRMFGTEFEMISKMFPGKQRRHVKLKFNREERHNPKRIDAALIGEKTIKMDIEEYRGFTGAQYESVEAIEAEQRRIQEGYEAERQRIADEQAEIMRKKKEELFADEDGEENGGRKKRGGKKKGKQAVAYGLNGEPIVQDS
ncbi:Transcription factor TFIIIB component B [Tolypocladium capitatum]|uniref:Transcription factor TFIIIB component B n=1 Tax=Tolypocladium capitatum TaxID=45235 RepID=A0A2K3Q7U7_9HYPO|nr:Transcription factor TFIIIB component B [Tolypocladium capitatum]